MERTFVVRTHADGTPVGEFHSGWSNEAAEFLRRGRFSRVLLDGKWGDMLFLAEFADFIREITIFNMDARAEGVATLRNLESLSVGNKTKRPIDFGKLMKLKSCTIKWNPSYADTLFALPRLEEIYISSYSAPDFRAIRTNSSVERLRLSSPLCENFGGIGNLRSLRSLHIQRAGRLTSLTGISELPALRNLYIDSAKKVVSCTELHTVSSLEHLALINVGGASGSRFVTGLDNLGFLAITGIPVDAEWQEIIALRALEKLTVLVTCEGIPSKEVLDEMAIKAGKRVVSVERSGVKRRPLLEVVLEKVHKSGPDHQ